MSLLGDALRRKRKEEEEKTPEAEPTGKRVISLSDSRPPRSTELKKTAGIKPVEEEPDLRDDSERTISWREEVNDDDQHAAAPALKPPVMSKPKVREVASSQPLSVQKRASQTKPSGKKRREWVAAFIVFLCLLLLVMIGGVIYHLVVYREDAVDMIFQRVFPATETTEKTTELAEVATDAEPRERTSRAARLIDTAARAADQAAERAREADEALAVGASDEVSAWPDPTPEMQPEPVQAPPPTVPAGAERSPQFPVQEEVAAAEEVVPADEASVAESTQPDTVVWPELRVQAAMGSGSSGSALVNGQLIDMGSTYQGVELIEITGRGVRMRYRDEERVIPVRR